MSAGQCRLARPLPPPEGDLLPQPGDVSNIQGPPRQAGGAVEQAEGRPAKVDGVDGAQLLGQRVCSMANKLCGGNAAAPPACCPTAAEGNVLPAELRGTHA